MATFEDKLLVELHNHVGTPQPAAAERPRLSRTAVGRAIAAVAAVAALTVAGLIGNGAAAYAVDTDSDGSITFTLLELRDLDGATKALNDAGVPALVREASTTCTDTASGAKAPSNLIEWPANGNTASVRIHPKAMPAGKVLGLTALSSKRAPVVKVLLYDAPVHRACPWGSPANERMRSAQCHRSARTVIAGNNARTGLRRLGAAACAMRLGGL